MAWLKNLKFTPEQLLLQKQIRLLPYAWGTDWI
jgi:hypothetical protein